MNLTTAVLMRPDRLAQLRPDAVRAACALAWSWQRNPGWDEESGRGLLLPEDKRVWFELTR